jgi:hypothetical protein
MRATDPSEACSEKRRQANGMSLNRSRAPFGSDSGAKRLFTGSVLHASKRRPDHIHYCPAIVVCFEQRLSDLMSASRSFARSSKGGGGDTLCQALRPND